MTPSELDPEFWQNRFHGIALAAGFLAASQGRLADSNYVRRLAYHFYEYGEWPSWLFEQIDKVTADR